jgi:tetratricopeptide (TPR) repeat protein
MVRHPDRSVDDAEGGQRAVKRRIVVPRAVCALVGIVLSGGCTSRDGAESAASTGVSARKAPDGSTLRPISLPELSRMTESVQKQIREGHSALMRKTENRATPLPELSDAYGQMGKLLMAAQYPEAAETCFLNAQALEAGDFRWPYYLAHLYRTRGELARSSALFERAIQLQPNDVAALIWLGEVSLAQGRADAAEPQFAKALALQPNSLSARFGLGRAALAREDYRPAVEHLEEVLRRDPKAAEHLRQRREHEILPADPLMVELEGLLQSPQTFETLGIRSLDREDWPEAAAQFRKGLELEPDNAALRHRLGTALYMMGDVESARAEFEHAVRVSPDYARAHYSLGVLAAANGGHPEAIERFSIALEHDANFTDARLRLAASLRRTARPGESLAHYEQLLAVDPAVTEAQVGYAMALVQLRRYQQARDRLTSAIKAYPEQPVFAHGLARLLAAAPDDRVRNGQQALALVDELLRTQQRTPDLGETMAMALAELGRYEEAAALQRNLIAGGEKAGAHGVVRRLAANLRLYERREPCRTPWAEDEMP